MAFTRDHGTCCIVLPLKLGVSLVAMLAFFDSIVCIVATLTGDIRFQPNGYNEHFYRVPVFIGVFGIFFGFSGLLGIYDDKPEWLRWLVHYLGVKQVALLATSIADYSTLWKCESWPTSSERARETNEQLLQLAEDRPIQPADCASAMKLKNPRVGPSASHASTRSDSKREQFFFHFCLGP
ncbi:unnamed protein product [Symbiodinium sp. KB8]|nr:unnamed protein product [Symbiodinium sp. KB8]